MERKAFLILSFFVCLSLVVEDVDAGWKFWKKKDQDGTTTTAVPGIASGVTPETKTSSSVTPPPRGGVANNKEINANKALTGAADPGLAIGVGSTGQDIKQNARPSRPNPGTEVGLDYSPPKPRPGLGPGNNGAGYRDWAAELTGAGQPSQPAPKLPSQGPALINEGGGRPTSLPGSISAQSQNGKPSSAPGNLSPQYPGGRPTSLPGNVPSQHQGSRQPPPLGPRPGSPDQGKPQVSPTNVGGSSPTALHPTPSPQNKPTPLNSLSNGGSDVLTGAGQRNDGRPRSPSASSATNGGGPDFPNLPKGSPNPVSSPTTGPRPGSPSWADVAAGGSRPNSPTPAPKLSGYPPTGGISTQTQPPGNSKFPAGSKIAAGTIIAGGAAAATGTAAGSVGKKSYSSNPTYSKGTAITDDDLEKLAEALFIKDRNNAMRYITLNLQKQTTSSDAVDGAPEPLFTISPEALQIPTIQKVLTIYDNYNPDQRTNEYISPAQRQEESLLVDTFLSTDVMASAMRFLADKGHVAKDYYEYKDTLRRLWFNLYSRGEGKIGSTGFEHVFLHEEKIQDSSTEIGGLHNWIYFSTEEKKGKVNYLGYMKKLDLGDKAAILKIHAKYNGYDKPTMTMFVGTSPELEMALYTVCHFARESKPCPVSLGGTKFNIATYKFRYRGKDLISSAFPDI